MSLIESDIERISTDAAGAQANGFSDAPIFSPDGAKVAFRSFASNLVAGDTNGVLDIFVVTLGAPNTAPVAADDAVSANEDSALAGDLLADNGAGADSDPDLDPLTVSAVNGSAANVGAQVTLASGALLTVNADGTFTYDPIGVFDSLPSGATAIDSFTYDISDGNGGTDAAIATVTINGVNDNHVAVPDNYNATENAPIVIDPLGNDFDMDGTPFISRIGGVDVTLLNPGDSFIVNSVNLITKNADGTFTYEFVLDSLAEGASGTSIFGYTLESASPGAVSTLPRINGQITVSILGVNDSPIAADDAFTVDEDTPRELDLRLDNGAGPDSDIDNGDILRVTSINGEAVAFGIPDNAVDLPSGSVVSFIGFGSVHYDPAGAFDSLRGGETATDTFIYTIGDGHGGTDTASVIVTINGVNDAPIAQDDTVSTDENAVLNGNVLADNGAGADSDPDLDLLTVSAVNGSSVDVGAQVTLASGALLTVNADGTFTYDPNGVFDSLPSGATAIDSFTYDISDGNGGTDAAVATVAINGVTSTTPTQFGDSLVGTSGDDTIDGLAGDDTIDGGAGNDFINGGGGADLLVGSAGDDTLRGGDGADSIDGGGGTDAATYEDASGGVNVSLVNLAAGVGNFAQGDTLFNIEILRGSAFGDTLSGSSAGDTLVGLSGDDTLKGDDGSDFLFAGTGNDRADGGLGDDFARTSNGNDTLLGGDGNDTLGAGSGTDLLNGHAGADLLLGSNGNDRLNGGDGNDTMQGGGGRDTLTGGAGDDRLVGGTENDRFNFAPGSGADTIVDFAGGAGLGDVIGLIGFGESFDTFAEAIAAATQVGGSVVIDLGGGDAITLPGVTLGGLDAGDFAFG